jgi:hypothetical protein
LFFAVDVGELGFAGAAFHVDGDVEGARGGDGAADAGEGDCGGLLVGDVGCGFGDEHECFFEAVEETLAGFDGAFDAELSVVAILISRNPDIVE